MLRRMIQANDRSLFITDTVFRALRELRYPDHPRKLWTDAVSINQGNIPERQSQVDMMGAIYRRAAQVIVWLGKAPGSLTSAFEYIERFYGRTTRRIRRQVMTNLVFGKNRSQTMLGSRWWSRVWIVPEVALADEVVIRSGPNENIVESLSKLPSIFQSSRKTLPWSPRIIKFRQDNHRALEGLRIPDPPLGQLHFRNFNSEIVWLQIRAM